MDDSAAKNIDYTMLLQSIFCLPCDISQEVRLEVVVLSGMQLLCETSWYSEILNEIHPQIQGPCRVAWGDMGMGKGFRLLSSLLLLHCFPWEPSWGPALLCGGASTAPARLDCPGALFVTNCPHLG